MTSDTSKWEGPMYQNTISVRLYGVDAPEIGMFIDIFFSDFIQSWN